MRGLGAVMGLNMFLEDFVPAVIGVRRQWFPQTEDFWDCGDPSGLDITNDGTRQSKIRDILSGFGIFPRSTAQSNRPETRTEAIQTVSGYMRRDALDGEPAFRIHPRAMVVSSAGMEPASFTVDGFEAGYVWDPKPRMSLTRTVRVPKKDGYWDHYQNSVEYCVVNFSPATPREKVTAASNARDVDPADNGYQPARRGGTGRGGY